MTVDKADERKLMQSYASRPSPTGRKILLKPLVDIIAV
jgi:hypothetical protein